MFYESVKAAYEAGKVRVILPALGHGARVYVEASGLTGLKTAFLSKSERQRLADRSKAEANATLGVCASCGTQLEPSLSAVLKGEHYCDCGAPYSVIYAMSDASQLRQLETDPEAILGNCSVRFEPKQNSPKE